MFSVFIVVQEESLAEQNNRLLKHGTAEPKGREYEGDKVQSLEHNIKRDDVF